MHLSHFFPSARNWSKGQFRFSPIAICSDPSLKSRAQQGDKHANAGLLGMAPAEVWASPTVGNTTFGARSTTGKLLTAAVFMRKKPVPKTLAPAHLCSLAGQVIHYLAEDPSQVPDELLCRPHAVLQGCAHGKRLQGRYFWIKGKWGINTQQAHLPSYSRRGALCVDKRMGSTHRKRPLVCASDLQRAACSPEEVAPPPSTCVLGVMEDLRLAVSDQLPAELEIFRRADREHLKLAAKGFNFPSVARVQPGGIAFLQVFVAVLLALRRCCFPGHVLQQEALPLLEGSYHLCQQRSM